jgi:hypothetical protein
MFIKDRVRVRPRSRLWVLLPTVVIVFFAIAGAASAALQFLPAGGATKVNDDPASGINPAQSVSGEDPANSDVVGGALTAGKTAVPWAVFRQQESGGAADQVFSRSFAGGAWTTRGVGTVGGTSSATPTFKGSLNFNQKEAGETPSIDFAGAGRTVPWATWYEDTVGQAFGKNNIFASRFDNTGDANQGKWIFSGQNRGTVGGIEVPSINIHTNQDAENPSVAGGSAVDPTKPGPWITWQETDTAPVAGKNQIFTVRPIGPASANCNGVKPAGVAVGGNVPAIGGFCWQQTGVPRAGAGKADPSLNVDPTRDGVEPDIAFTGSNDSVPWVVWYETGPTRLNGLHTNEMVFAAKAVSDSGTTDGGFHWTAVGNSLQELLNTAGANGFGQCAVSAANEAGCSLNSNPAADAEDPQVAAGTMNPANPTVPWVAWDEQVAGVNSVFVSRLVGGATGHFVITNGGSPISTPKVNATRVTITFSGNTPYVTWREPVPGAAFDHVFVGHFVNPSSPTFVLDSNTIQATPSAQADVREPISSSCTANPFNSDGSACQGGTSTAGTPFLLYTKGTSPRSLFAAAYRPGAPVTNPATAISSTGATLNGSVNPVGASARVSFQFGTTTAYGSTTPSQLLPVANAVTPFSAGITGLTSGTTYHFRTVVTSDFGTFVGSDRTFTTS